MAEAAVADLDRPRSRPFTLGDAMILIVALALALAIARPGIAMIANALRTVPHSQFRTLAGAVQLGRVLNIVLLNFLFFLLPAFLILRLKHPRPPWRSMLGQPGFAGCAAVVAVVVVALPLSLLAPSGPGQLFVESAAQVLLPGAVPLAWVWMIAKSRWNPEPSWIDRMGRILGVLWMVSLPALVILNYLPY
jgi:hypothetical protein